MEIGIKLGGNVDILAIYPPIPRRTSLVAIRIELTGLPHGLPFSSSQIYAQVLITE